MVFDDSLSAVDAETDLKIRTQLKTHLGGSTVILISHRVTTLMSADCILVLDKGRVQQMGTHEELHGAGGHLPPHLQHADEQRGNRMTEKTTHSDYKVRLPWFGLPRLVPFLKPYKGIVICMAVLVLLNGVIDICLPLFQQYAINNFIAKGTLQGLGGFIGLYVCVIALQIVFSMIDAYQACQIEMYVGRDLKRASFNHLQTLSFSYFNQNSVGYIHARVMSDTNRIGSIVAWGLMDMVWNALVPCGRDRGHVRHQLAPGAVGGGADPRHHPDRGLLPEQAHPCSTAACARSTPRSPATSTRASPAPRPQRPWSWRTRWSRTSSRTTRGHAQDLASAPRATARPSSPSSCSRPPLRWRWCSGAGAALAMTSETLMQIGTLSVFMNYALGLMEPIQTLVRMICRAHQRPGQHRALHEPAGHATRTWRTAPRSSKSTATPSSPKRENWEPLHGDVEFQDVSFKYPDGEEYVLEHFNLKVPQGTNVAIVGETGAGKCTLVNLVCRFFEPTQGPASSSTGADARERSQLWLHSNIGYVLQTPHLFSGNGAGKPALRQARRHHGGDRGRLQGRFARTRSSTSSKTATTATSARAATCSPPAASS